MIGMISIKKDEMFSSQCLTTFNNVIGEWEMKKEGK